MPSKLVSSVLLGGVLFLGSMVRRDQITLQQALLFSLVALSDQVTVAAPTSYACGA